LQTCATSTILSGTLGAKQDVVVSIHTILSGPNSIIFSSIASKFVTRESSICFSSITTGIKFALIMHFKQVF